jgi:hypothetical protein
MIKNCLIESGPPCSSDVRNYKTVISLAIRFMGWCLIAEHRDPFTFTVTTVGNQASCLKSVSYLM